MEIEIFISKMDSHIEKAKYCGRIFTRNLKSKQRSHQVYFRRKTTHGIEYLHHKIYIDHYGNIPSGHLIHHKDGNPLNNDPKNLEAVDACLHLKTFHKYRMNSPKIKKICEICGASFEAKQKRSRFCPSCNTINNYKEHKSKNKK